MRLIDADSLEKAIYKWMPKDMETWADSSIPPIEDLVVSIIMTIEEQPTVNQWIPVSQQLPNDQSAVIITVKESFLNAPCVEVAIYSDKKFYTSVGGELVEVDVLAWMELPKPYKGGKE